MENQDRDEEPQRLRLFAFDLLGCVGCA